MVDALDLIVLGRRLTRIGEQMLRQSTGPSVTTGPSLVLRHVVAHPDVSINDIAEGTSLPQSYVSESVGKLAGQGVLQTTVDPNDRRRTLVRASKRHLRTLAQRGRATVDAAVIEALGPNNTDAAQEVLAALTMLSGRLGPETPGPILRQVRSAGSSKD